MFSRHCSLSATQGQAVHQGVETDSKKEQEKAQRGPMAPWVLKKVLVVGPQILQPMQSRVRIIMRAFRTEFRNAGH